VIESFRRDERKSGANSQNISPVGGSWTTTVADGTPLNITATSGTPATNA